MPGSSKAVLGSLSDVPYLSGFVSMDSLGGDGKGDIVCSLFGVPPEAPSDPFLHCQLRTPGQMIQLLCILVSSLENGIEREATTQWSYPANSEPLLSRDHLCIPALWPSALVVQQSPKRQVL